MVKVGSYVECIDTTGVHLVKIFKVYGASYKREINLGDVVFVVIKSVDTKAHYLKDERVKSKFSKGSLHRAIVVHTKKKIKRSNRAFIGFLKSAIILVNKSKIPFSKRIKFGIPKEIANKFPALGSISPKIL